MRKAALMLAAAAALIAGLLGTSAAIEGVADAGVLPDLESGIIRSVSPTGFAWRDGIRPGQRILSISSSDEAGGWHLETEDSSGGLHASRSAPVDEALRDSRPLGMAAITLAALAILFLRTRRGWALPAAVVALQMASVPLWIHGNADLSSWAMAIAALVPAAWLVWRAPIGLGPRVTWAIAVAGGLGFWLVARLSGQPSYEALDLMRSVLAVCGTAAIVIEHGIVQRPQAEKLEGRRFTAKDAAVIGLLGGISLVLAYFLRIPFVAAGLVTIGSLLALPRLRRLVGRRLQDAILADMREQALAEATERERGRLARELHDVPLQHLVAVARRLELIPGAEAEAEQVQLVVGQLREVATNLRPPVLDDLGLAASIEFLADEMASTGQGVLVEVDNRAGIETEQRPPEEVELAAFRIVQEAVINAHRHGRASRVVVRGRIDPDSVNLEVQDDGMGISPERQREATWHGHMGLASMRRRAQAIDADLSIDGSGGGTTVHLEWTA